MQPWRVHVVSGRARDRVGAAVRAAAQAGAENPDYRYYPDPFFEPFTSRRRRLGYDLYARLGVDRADVSAREAQRLENFAFFGAPVGLFVTVDRRLNPGSWLDCAFFIQTLMLAARGVGLESCAQASWVPYADVVRASLGIDAGEVLLCGIALGYPDETAPENRLETERAAVADFTTWHEA